MRGFGWPSLWRDFCFVVGLSWIGVGCGVLFVTAIVIVAMYVYLVLPLCGGWLLGVDGACYSYVWLYGCLLA